MRILFLSNFYPPARPGGYAQWCHEVAEGLADRGHDISVLTSRHQADRAAPDPQIRRQLHLDGDLLHYRPLHFFTRRKRERRENRRFLQSAIEDYRPEVAFIWGLWAMSPWMAAWAEASMPGRVVYYLSDYWPAGGDFHHSYWGLPARRSVMQMPKRIVNRLAQAALAREGSPDLKFEHAICVSEAVKKILIEKHVPVEKAAVIHGGSDLKRFLSADATRTHNGGVALLYAGQLVPHKGVHTAIEGVSRLVHDQGVRDVHLTVVGAGPPAYERELHELVEARGVDRFVRFQGPADKSDMPAIFASHDILIFPSIYEEPLARVTQEAMASGMTVVGTTTGGTGEILEEGRTGLTFPAGDAGQLARQLGRLIHSPELGARLGQAGREVVSRHFTLDRMVDEIEAYLTSVVVA
jgi:glycosyltransferase involved in cell wall biosynthesis